MEKERSVLMIGGVSTQPYAGYGAYSPYDNYQKAGNLEKAEQDKAISGECETCKNRKYQDGSNENVSFKSATRISPEAAASAVRSHEGEHVSNAYTSASQKNGKVIMASVSIHTSICPECGKNYVSGGTTNTKVKYPVNPYENTKKVLSEEASKGQTIDYAA